MNIQAHNLRILNRNDVPPEVHNTPEARRLKEATQQFESILWSQIWRQQIDSARAISGSNEERPWRQMEELALSMASEELTIQGGGAGLWKMLYHEMIGHVAAGMRAQEENA